MPRTRRSSFVHDVIHIVSRMPWWLGVLLAVVSYFLCHRFASPVALTSARVGQVAVQSIVTGLASVMQYVLPLLCLIGAGVSAWRNREQSQLLHQAQTPSAADAIDGMSWQQFERLVAAGFQRKGFVVSETGGGGPDGGVDLVLRKGGEKFLVQCKQWRATKVGVEVVRELYGVMAARGAVGGYVVTSGRFSADAAKFAEGRNIRLMDGERLLSLLHKVQEAPLPISTKALANEPVPSHEVPPCPLCAKPMVLRQAKRGLNSGAAFWGCAGYPACRGTRKA